jgi:hypothetical protein
LLGADHREDRESGSVLGALAWQPADAALNVIEESSEFEFRATLQIVFCDFDHLGPPLFSPPDMGRVGGREFRRGLTLHPVNDGDERSGEGFTPCSGSEHFGFSSSGNAPAHSGAGKKGAWQSEDDAS